MGAFVSNIWFEIAGKDGGYFAKTSGVQFLLHTWSLSVEEQFYLVIPLLFVVTKKQSDAFKLRLLAILCVLSFAVSVVAVSRFPLEGFYGVASRAWELLLGSLLAFGLSARDPARRTRDVLAFVGLALIVAAIALLETSTPFPGAAALPPCCGTCLLIAAGGGTKVARALSTRPMVAIGRMSYSLYLWHWPFVAVVRLGEEGLARLRRAAVPPPPVSDRVRLGAGRARRWAASSASLRARLRRESGSPRGGGLPSRCPIGSERIATRTSSRSSLYEARPQRPARELNLCARHGGCRTRVEEPVDLETPAAPRGACARSSIAGAGR